MILRRVICAGRGGFFRLILLRLSSMIVSLAIMWGGAAAVPLKGYFTAPSLSITTRHIMVGGVRESFLIDCLVANNTGSGVAYSGDLRAALNCTIVNNSTYGLQNAGGVNCIIVGNQSGLRTGTEYSISNSVIQSAHALGVNSIVTNNAFFVNPDGGDYRVFANSAAIDIGDALVTNGALPPAERRDIAGQPRLQGAGIDAGCY